MSRVNLGATTIELRDGDLLGEGGEGRVYRHGSDEALKIYFSPSRARQEKLEAFPPGLAREVKGPLELATDEATGAVVGYRMERVSGGFDLGRLSERTFRDRERIPNALVLSAFGRLVTLLDALHERQVVVGDLNAGNVMFTRDAGTMRPSVIDADSMQYASFPCVVAHERYVHPSIYGKDLASGLHFTQATDDYALAVLLFESLLFVHPYGGVHPNHPTLPKRALARVSILDEQVKRPKNAERPEVLDDDWLSFFSDVFERGAMRALPMRLLASTRFQRCGSCGHEHARRSCPTCTSACAVPSSLPASRGPSRNERRPEVHLVHDGGLSPVVAVATQGTTLLYASIEGSRLVRESGVSIDLATALPTWEREPFRVALEARATYLVTDDAAHRFDHDDARVLAASAPTERFGSSCARGRSTLATTPGEVLRIRGGVLERLRAGTRVGAVLEGRTELFSGSSLAFAFYRMGKLAFGFLFSPHEGPLRQVELPSFSGRIVRTFAHFDRDHVLFGAHVDNGVEIRCILHLFDARGSRLAHAEGPLESEPLFTYAAQGALFGGRLLLPSDAGLVLYGAQRTPDGRLEALRQFPETATVVSPDAELHVDARGVVYAATFARIVRLSI